LTTQLSGCGERLPAEVLQSGPREPCCGREPQGFFLARAALLVGYQFFDESGYSSLSSLLAAGVSCRRRQN